MRSKAIRSERKLLLAHLFRNSGEQSQRFTMIKSKKKEILNRMRKVSYWMINMVPSLSAQSRALLKQEEASTQHCASMRRS